MTLDPTSTLDSRELDPHDSRHGVIAHEPAGGATKAVSALLSNLAGQLGIPIAQISPGSSLTRDLGLDRWDLFELIEGLEAELPIAVSDEAIEGLRCVSDLVEAVTAAGAR